ncbi:hypothetical protein BBBOND_0201110 [Babesia bigemina]|uniref:6-Cys domain-containing protein n=1 Tax=Babesia bigemina TaxID=5866 RepID=A0A061D7S1_BABBI|nr:hypothetical protein BBBOND_0201110 [Babesia bigemina]CDR94954.1 hypothetical protein BBBOND_0201110 [Babesia bigemina]|eukprot:XP_012767140.1 hypothetical protein BBBOND_0201110 [Babesia bigemina]
MVKFSIMKYVLALYAISILSIRFIGALYFDFGNPYDLLISNALVGCDMDMDAIETAAIICPNRVNDTEYVWHPQPRAGNHTSIYTYVSGNDTLDSVPISEVVRSESVNAVLWFKFKVSQTELHYTKEFDQLITVTKHRLMFICGPRDMVLSDELQRHLEQLDSFNEVQAFPWVPGTSLTQEISKIGSGLGVFYLHRRNMYLPLQGCGSRPSPLFDPDMEVTLDPVTYTRSCTADPMSETRIAFVCEGLIEPDGCMKSLINQNDQVVPAPEPQSYWTFNKRGKWIISSYFDGLALPSFHGECRCIDPWTGHVKARIEIRPKTEYSCDIASMLLRNGIRSIPGTWCSVILHPGSTLTIRLPTDGVDSGSGEDLPQLLPKDLTTLRQLKSLRDIDLYDEIPRHQALAGDALELDVSQMDRGEVKLKYHLGKPLTLIGGLNSFVYHWNLKSTNEYLLERIRATVNVSFAFTHEYEMFGCDRRTPGVFHSFASEEYCSTKLMGNGIGPTYECVCDMSLDSGQAGIYCRPDEVLLPENCKSRMYDIFSNQITPMPKSMKNVTLQSISGFQVIQHKSESYIPLSYACMCINEYGYETSRLLLENNRYESQEYTVDREEASITSIPYIVLPWNEVEVSSEDLTKDKHLVLYNIHQKSVKLRVGTTLSMTCAFGRDAQNYVANNSDITTTWLPVQPEVFHYVLTETTHGDGLIRKAYKDAILTTPDGFSVVLYDDPSQENQHLIIESHRGAILISKDPLHKKLVPMAFVCGKAPEPSDFSVITHDMTASDSSSDSISQTTIWPERYTWNVVEVAVEMTDPYMQGCGVTSSLDELFKPETPLIYNEKGEDSGCKIDLQTAGEAAFYCPVPYVLDPPGCFNQVSVNGEVKNLSDISQSLVASHSNHFVTVRLYSSLAGPYETLRQTPPLECRCVTIKGIVLSTIQIENYYSK